MANFAIVYLYRPGKLTNSLSDFIVYLNDDAICVAKNNTGYTFKILREGPVKFTSRIHNDLFDLPVEIEFGKTYYIKSMIHWGFFKGKNYRLEIANVEKSKGQDEYAELKNQW